MFRLFCGSDPEGDAVENVCVGCFPVLLSEGVERLRLCVCVCEGVDCIKETSENGNFK